MTAVLLRAGLGEAARLCRNPLVLAGAVLTALLVWWNSRSAVPQWWVWDVQLGSCLLALALPVLVAAHLATGRARRDELAELYESYPAPAAVRTGAHLLGLCGPLLLALVLLAACVAWLDGRTAVGSPRSVVLLQALLLVAFAGALGVALGAWLPAASVGILVAIVWGILEAALIAPELAPLQLPGGLAWLFPWTQPPNLSQLPGPIPRVPPGSHLVWLCGQSAVLGLATLYRFTSRRRVVAVAAAACLTAVAWSGWAQTRPVPSKAQRDLLATLVQPAQYERCALRSRVSYCAYPSYESIVDKWAAVVDAVLGQLPSPPARTLVVRQVATRNVYLAPHYPYPPSSSAQRRLLAELNEQMSRFLLGVLTDPGLIPDSGQPPVYVGLSWGSGAAEGGYQLNLAIQVAWWLVGLPTAGSGYPYRPGPVPDGTPATCAATGQAREPIALWLAASATPATRATFTGDEAFSYHPFSATADPTNLNITAQGAALARAMLRLPHQRVASVLASHWPDWLGPRATDAQLATALGIAMPAGANPVPANGFGPDALPTCQ